MQGKKILAFFGLVLGLVGLIGCTGVAIAVWPVSNDATTRVKEIADNVEPVLKKVGERLGKWESLLNEVKAENEKIQSAARNVAKLGSASDPADWQTMQTVFSTASSALDKAERVIHGVELAISTMQNIDKMVSLMQKSSDAASETNPDTLDKIESKLKAVEKAIQKIRNEKDPKKNAEKVARISEDFDALLTSVTNPVSRLRQRVNDVDERVITLESSIVYWGKNGPILVTILCVWLALGQWCLVAVSWSKLRSSEDV